MGTQLNQASRRRLLTTGAVAAGGSLLAACGGRSPAAGSAGGSAPTAKGTVTFMSQGTDPTDEQRYRPLVDAFNGAGGPVKIDLIQGDPGGSAVDAQGKLLTMAAAGSAPDVFWTHAYITPNLIKLKLLQEISSYLQRDPEVKLSAFFEAPTKDYEANGKQYGLPREATTTVLVVNKDLFNREGVALPTEAWSWNDFTEAARRLTTNRESPDATWGTAGWLGSKASQFYSYIKVWQEGGDVVDATRTKFTLHQSPAVEQMQWLSELVTKQQLHPPADALPAAGLKDAWNTGRLGMIVSYSVYSTFDKAQFDWDIFHLPKGKNRVTRTASAGHSMTADSKNKDAAWQVMRMLASKPSFEHWAKLGLTIPTYKEVAAGPLVLKPEVAPKNAKVAQDAFAYARPEPISGDWGNVGAEIGKAMQPVYEGALDARTALSAAAPVIEALLSKTPIVATPTAGAAR